MDCLRPMAPRTVIPNCAIAQGARICGPLARVWQGFPRMIWRRKIAYCAVHGDHAPEVVQRFICLVSSPPTCNAGHVRIKPQEAFAISRGRRQEPPCRVLEHSTAAKVGR